MTRLKVTRKNRITRKSRAISAKISSCFLLPAPVSASMCEAVHPAESSKSLMLLRERFAFKIWLIEAVIAAEGRAKNRLLHRNLPKKCLRFLASPSSSLSFFFSSFFSSPLPPLHFIPHPLNLADVYTSVPLRQGRGVPTYALNALPEAGRAVFSKNLPFKLPVLCELSSGKWT